MKGCVKLYTFEDNLLFCEVDEGCLNSEVSIWFCSLFYELVKGFKIMPFPKVSATLSPNNKIPAMFKAQAKTIANFNFKYPEPTAGAKVSSFEPMPKLIIDAPQILKMSNRNIGKVTISTHISENCYII